MKHDDLSYKKKNLKSHGPATVLPLFLPSVALIGWTPSNRPTAVTHIFAISLQHPRERSSWT